MDKIIDSLTMFVNACDLTGLREFWQILSSQLFSRLESTQIITVKKMETYLYRWYLCNAIQTHRAEKVNEFFEIMTPELFNQPEWKDWFGKKILLIFIVSSLAMFCLQLLYYVFNAMFLSKYIFWYFMHFL